VINYTQRLFFLLTRSVQEHVVTKCDEALLLDCTVRLSLEPQTKERSESANLTSYLTMHLSALEALFATMRYIN